MSNQIKDGKRPLSQKAAPSAPISSFDAFGNPLMIPDDVQAELKAKGLVGRWVSAPDMVKNSGYHKRGWQVYRRDKVAGGDILFGSNPDGSIRRGDCVLAVKTIAEHKRHKDYLEYKASELSSSKASLKSKFRQALKESGLGSKVDESYDEEE